MALRNAMKYFEILKKKRKLSFVLNAMQGLLDSYLLYNSIPTLLENLFYFKMKEKPTEN